MRTAQSCLVVLGLVACKNEPFRPDAAIDGPPEIDAPTDAPIDGPPPTWWVPKPGEAKNWDIQLNGTIDLSEQRAVYVLELFDVVPEATTLTYPDGGTVNVPAGAQATAIASLHATTPPTKVVCRVATGAIDLDDPDAPKFPGFSANPPNRPTPPASTSVIGWTTRDPNNPNERFLDITEGRRDFWVPLILKRFELAKQIGCDAIYADRVDLVKAGPGWTPTDADQESWHAMITADAHARGISIGMRSEYPVASVVLKMAQHFDWVIQDRCAEAADCGKMGPFTGNGKAAFGIDLRPPVTSGKGIEAAAACPRFLAGLTDGIVKDEALSSAFRAGCP